MNVSSEDLAIILGWGTVVLGLVLTAKGVQSTLYFRRQHALLENNWVMTVVYRTVFTITAGCLILTLSRAYSLTFGPNIWTPVLGGVVVVWILSIPWIKMRAFKAHEGAPMDRTETAIQQEDREVGNERRSRQEKNGT